MIEFMDKIVEASEYFIKRMAENALIMSGILAKFFILITTPVWILPYKVIRELYGRFKKSN